MNKKRALILYTSIGSGHRIAGEAILDELLLQGFDAKTEDILAYSEMKISAVTEKMAIRNKTLGSIYDFLWKQEFAKDIANKSTGIFKENFQQLKQLIVNYKPDVIVCTQALAALLASEFLPNKPIYGVVTDFKVTPVWLASKLSHYFVPNLPSKTYLLEKGVDAKSVSITGIPVRKGFESNKNSKKYRKKKHLKVFILVGGLNQMKYFGHSTNLINQIKEIAKDHLTTVVCGSNEILKKKLNEFSSRNLKVFGKSDDPATLMKEADVIITKPGGLICAESLALGKPLLLIGEGYGQEKGNVDYTTNNGAAISVEKISEVAQAIRIIHVYDILKTMVRNAIRLGRPKATKIIVKFIMKGIKDDR